LAIKVTANRLYGICFISLLVSRARSNPTTCERQQYSLTVV
jgi:hypothetical protein